MHEILNSTESQNNNIPPPPLIPSLARHYIELVNGESNIPSLGYNTIDTNFNVIYDISIDSKISVLSEIYI